MIEELHIRALGVIEDASLHLSPGFTVVTGETGAGKTMVVTALELLLGARADGNLVRTGTDCAHIEAVVHPAPEAARPWVDDMDAPVIVSREIPADGRSRARINGRLVPISALTELLGASVEVHAQHEHVRLARTDVQRDLLDRYAGEVHQRTLGQYRERHSAWHELLQRRATLQQDTQARARELDRLHYEIAEIDAAGLDPDSDGSIGTELARFERADEILQTVGVAVEALGSDGAGDVIGRAVDALRRLDLDDADVNSLRDRVEALAAESSELARDLRAYGEAVEADPARLAALQDRQRVLADLQRKYGEDVAAVLGYRQAAADRATELEAATSDESALGEQIDAIHAELIDLAERLSHGRRTAAQRLADDCNAHLADLGMPHARFAVDITEVDDLTADGANRIVFQLAANPGEPARELARAASGGERSRVSLAIEVALADVDGVQVLVFDEVDAGIGGTTAMAVGEKLARLSLQGDAQRQVVCVTHLAQLAAFADVHHVVEKGVAGGRTVTTSRHVDEDARVNELSRMLGGDALAAEGIDHARMLLDTAQSRRAS